MPDIERLIIVVLGKWDAGVQDGWYRLHKKYFHVCSSNECRHSILYGNCNGGVSVSATVPVSYNLVFIREDYCLGANYFNTFKEAVINIINNSNKQVAIAVHHTSGRLSAVNLAVRGQQHVHLPKEFSRDNNRIWSNLNPLIDCIVNNGTNYNELFDKLWQCLAPKPSEVAHSLRSEILTPFIPFHLFHQLGIKELLSTDKEWQNIFKECCSVINNHDPEKNIEEKFNKLKELKNDISSDIKNCTDKKFTELKKYFRIGENECTNNNVEKNNCRKTIEDFAQCLEKIVNCIESDEKN